MPPTGEGPSEEKHCLLEAVDLTLNTFARRAKLYRNLVVAVSLVSLASILAALLWWRALPLSGLILLIPFSGAFVYFDARWVSRWRAGILGMCRARGLDLAVFRNALSQFKQLPQGSLQSMLATLTADAPESTTPGWRMLVAPAALTVVFAGVATALQLKSMWPLLIAGGGAAVFALAGRSKANQRHDA